jgi:hypothetical protein
MEGARGGGILVVIYTKRIINTLYCRESAKTVKKHAFCICRRNHFYNFIGEIQYLFTPYEKKTRGIKNLLPILFLIPYTGIMVKIQKKSKKYVNVSRSV